MRIILLAALLLPVHALAEQCKPESVEPCTPGRGEKDSILSAIEKGMIAEQTINKEELVVKIADAQARR